MKKFFVLAIVLCLSLASCMPTAPQPRVIVNSFPIDQPFEAVWTAVIETFSDMSLPILNMEKASGLITTDLIDFTAAQWVRYADCGNLGDYSPVSRRGKFNVFVKKVGATCEVKVNAMFSLIVQFALNGERRDQQCVSRGNFEADFFKIITDKIK